MLEGWLSALFTLPRDRALAMLADISDTSCTPRAGTSKHAEN